MKQSASAGSMRPVQKKKIYKKITALDVGLIVILIILSLTSCFAIYNTFNLISYGSGLSNLLKQMMFLGLGFFVMFIMRAFQNKALYQYFVYAYWFLMGCLFYLFVSRIINMFTGYYLPFASPVNGATSWFNFPFISFQPSEFMKIVLIVLCSKIIADYQKKYPNPTVRNDFELFFAVLKIAIPPLVLIFIQPDTGLCMIIVFTLFILLLCSGIRKQYIWISVILFVVAVGGFFYLYFEHQDFLTRFLESYRLQRIEAWLHPDEYITGSSNQLYTALLSLGSAGLTGHGLQANIISIPEAHTDFIFAAFGQCFGLIGTTFIVGLCFVLDVYLCMMANRMKERMDKFIIIGVIAMLFYQQLQNLGMIVGLLPITGITLPLISYGGSSVLSYFIMFGYILNMKENPKKDRSRKTAKA